MKPAELTNKIVNALFYRVKQSDRSVGRPKKCVSEDRTEQCGKMPKTASVGRPKKCVSEDRTEQWGKMPKTAAPQHDVNFDEIGHWLQCVKKRQVQSMQDDKLS